MLQYRLYLLKIAKSHDKFWYGFPISSKKQVKWEKGFFMARIIGREKQIRELERLYAKSEPVFLALYGRRRIGKTFLINELFKDRIVFKHTGSSPDEFENMTNAEILRAQLEFFADSLKEHGASLNHPLSSWREAFQELKALLKQMGNEGRKVIFIDEMPWLDVEGSLFVPSFAHFWNDFLSTRDDIMLIVCGSASSWINNKLLQNKKDLYRRVTHEMKLPPFTLRQCEELLSCNGIDYRRYQITQAYMIFGGIPLYWKYLSEDCTLEQNIDNLFFVKNATLRREFRELFKSTFENGELAEKTVRLLSASKSGLSRQEIFEKLGKSSGGDITKLLNALIDGDFVLKYKSYKTKERYWSYKLVDQFSLFYLRFVENHQMIDEYFWSKNFLSPSIKAWQGNIFETVAFNHIPQIKRKIGIDGLATMESLWCQKGDADNKGAQIDLIIERKDNIINLCEAKFTAGQYEVGKEDYEKANEREISFASILSKRTIIHHVLLTTFGLKRNAYSDLYRIVVDLDDLFAF